MEMEPFPVTEQSVNAVVLVSLVSNSSTGRLHPRPSCNNRKTFSNVCLCFVLDVQNLHTMGAGQYMEYECDKSYIARLQPPAARSTALPSVTMSKRICRLRTLPILAGPHVPEATWSTIWR